MKKTNIIVVIIVLIIIVGIFGNSFALNYKYANGDFDSEKAYKEMSVSIELFKINSIHIVNSEVDTLINENGRVWISLNDSISEKYIPKQEALFNIKGNNLTCNIQKRFNVKINVAELNDLKVEISRNVEIQDFVSKELNVNVSNGASISFINCEIEVLNVIAANAANVSVDSTCVIKTLYVNLSTKATFSAETSCAEEFNYIVYDDCFLEVPEGMRKK